MNNNLIDLLLFFQNMKKWKKVSGLKSDVIEAQSSHQHNFFGSQVLLQEMKNVQFKFFNLELKYIQNFKSLFFR